MKKYFTAFFFLPAIIFIGCNSSQVTDTENNKFNKPIRKTFDFQGHRGSRGLMPENTIPAMFKAIDLGVATLEMDVVFTKDNVAILSHEPFFNHEISTKPQTASKTIAIVLFRFLPHPERLLLK